MRLRSAAIALSVLAFVAPEIPLTAGPASAAVTACGWRTTTTYRHVIWIFMENRTYSSVLGNGTASPKLSSYAAKCGLATDYTAITHPSLPNYLAATSGTPGSTTTDCQPAVCPQSRNSIFTQLTAAKKTWRAYDESMPSNCYLDNAGTYAPRHNPAVYYVPAATQCKTNDVPMGSSTGVFAYALAHKTLPSFSFVTPNLCNDGHDCSTAIADSWLGVWLARIVASPAYRAGDTALFLTWDEGVGTNQRIATVVIAPTVHAATKAPLHYTHYSLLRTTEEMLGVGLLNNARTARSMRSAFHL